jgi:phosphate transport system protein
MRTTFDRELADLHGRLVALGRTVWAQLDDALVALANCDADAAERVIRRHRQVGQVSAEIEWGLLCILARQAPVARDLRLVAGLLHVNEHLERMGGLCANVAKAVPGLANRPPPTEALVMVNEMGAHVRRVVTASLACLADGDAAAAERLPAIDQAVDRLNDRVFAPDQEVQRTDSAWLGTPAGAPGPLPGAPRRPGGRCRRTGPLHCHR